jgi:hypothetical protein
MTSTKKILAMIERAQMQVAAMESLAGGMAAGLREGIVDVDHVYTLVATQAAAVRAQLDKMEVALTTSGE